MEISAQTTTAAQPDRAATAVAHSYDAYAGGHNSVGLDPATAVPGTSVLADALESCGLGTLC